MQLREEVWAPGDRRVSTSSPFMPAHGFRLVGASHLSRSFAVSGLLQFQHPSSGGKCLLQFSSPFSPTYERDTGVALAGG